MFLFLPEFPAIQGFEDNHIGQNKSLCLLDLIYYSIRLDLSIIISFLLRCKTSKIMITFKNFSRCVIFCYICHWILANPIRGKDAGLSTYELCKFQTGKIYNCDLSASYNIGARYFIREIEKIYTGKSICKKISIWSDIQAKVPECQRRTQNTLSTLRAIHQYLAI